jgi:hypothetical protein
MGQSTHLIVQKLTGRTNVGLLELKAAAEANSMASTVRNIMVVRILIVYN